VLDAAARAGGIGGGESKAVREVWTACQWVWWAIDDSFRWAGGL
jgi:hypothetical protein